LTTRKHELPFDDLEGLLKMKDEYTFGLPQDSAALATIEVGSVLRANI